jgi:hypothetical protein
MPNSSRLLRLEYVTRVNAVLLCLILSACGSDGGGGGKPVANTFAIDATVSGLSGPGLILSVTANGTISVPVAANGSVTLIGAVAANTAYTVAVATQPSPTLACTVANGSGTVGNADVTNINISCAAPTTYAVNATVSGLGGAGLVLVVFSVVVNAGGGGDTDHSFGDVAVPANGDVTLATNLPANAQYLVQIVGQPSSPSQTCTISNATGTIASIVAMPVTVSCVANFTISATVSGLTGTEVLQLNGGDNLTVSANGVATFTTEFPPGAAYTVTAVGPAYCTVMNPVGTMPAAALNLNVVCGPGYTIGGTVSGLSGATGVELQIVGNGASATSKILSNGPFTLDGLSSNNPLFAPDAPYSVTVVQQPLLPTQTCTIANGTGTTLNANVTNIQVSCTPQGHAVTGNVFGLAGQGLILQLNGAGNLAVMQNGAVSFPQPVPTGTPYAITVATQPSAPAQNCSVGNATGTVGTVNVSNLQVVCLSPATANTGAPRAGQNAYFIGTAPNSSASNGVLIFPANAGGTVLSTALTPVNSSDQFLAVANDAAGNLYVTAVTMVNALASNPRVLSFSAGSTGAAAPLSAIQLPAGSAPQSIAVDGNGNLYVSGSASSGNFIYEFTAGSVGNAAPTRTLLLGPGTCAVMAVDVNNNIVCVSLGQMQTVSVYGPTQSGTAEPARSFYPGYPYPQGFLPGDPDVNTFGVVQGLGLDPAGNIYMAVAAFNSPLGPEPEAILKATGGTSATDNGTVVPSLFSALLNASFGPIQIDAAGNLYVLEPVTATDNVLWRFAAQNGGFAPPTTEGLSFQLANPAAFAVH